ncbi:hypothetical protein ACFWBI_12070 [Streptomyces sp. NPDC059982]|uniref:hypothetical protein n=1 Tax=unclassified Streptomyces TaxID=2593676 RepID=UPI0036B8B8B3
MAGRTGERAGPDRIRWGWCRAGAWALLALALSAATAPAALALPGVVADERVFARARPCGGDGAPAARDAAAAAAESADCLRTVRATVLSAGKVKSGRATVFRVRLRPPVPPPADRPVHLTAGGALSELVRPGAELEVTTWRGVQVSVARGGTVERLPGLPDEGAAMDTGVALVGVWSGGLALIAAFGAARRARRSAAGRTYVPRIRFGPAKGAGVLLVPLAAGFLARRLADGWVAVALTVVLWALLAVPATIAALCWDRPRRGALDRKIEHPF